MKTKYDLVVIGGGTAGLVSAAGAASLGARVALVERDKLGGECLNYGCVPTKALIRSAKVASLMRRAGEFGLEPVPVEVDFPAVMETVHTYPTLSEGVKKAGDNYYREKLFTDRNGKLLSAFFGARRLLTRS